MDDQLTSLQQLLDAVMSMWTKISALLNLCKEESRRFRSQKAVHPEAVPNKEVSKCMDGSNLLQFDNLSQLIYILKQHLTADHITNNLFFKPNNKIFFHVSTALSCLSKLCTHNLLWLHGTRLFCLGCVTS